MTYTGEVLAPASKQEVTLDKRDKDIINILTLNSRTPLSQVAKYLKTSTEVVNYHYTSLRKRGIITDVFAVLDPELLNIHRYAMYFQFRALSQEKMKTVIDHFLKNKYVSWVIETGGRWEKLCS